jgi:predicted nucleotidyltransferase
LTQKADYGLYRTILAGSDYYGSRIVHGTLVTDKEYNVYSVIGIPFYPGTLVAFKKYELCRKNMGANSIWNKENTRYCRLVRDYSQYSILVGKKLIEDPRFNTSLPALSLTDVVKIYDPFTRLKEVIRYPRDSLESDVIVFLNKVSEDLRLELDLWGLTGSLLAGIHNPVHSDIDFLVTGDFYSETVYEYVKNNGFQKLVNWKNVLSRYIISPPLLKILSMGRSRFLWKPGRIVSITFIEGDVLHPKTCRSENGLLSLGYNHFILDEIVDFEGRVKIEPISGSSLTYPPCTYSKDYIILSFDHILAPILHDAKCLYVKGQLARTVDGFEIILLGTKEKPRVIIKDC